jgi:hypothetical protein
MIRSHGSNHGGTTGDDIIDSLLDKWSLSSTTIIKTFD